MCHELVSRKLLTVSPVKDRDSFPPSPEIEVSVCFRVSPLRVLGLLSLPPGPCVPFLSSGSVVGSGLGAARFRSPKTLNGEFGRGGRRWDSFLFLDAADRVPGFFFSPRG